MPLTPYDHLDQTFNTPSGVADYLYWAPVSWFTTIACYDPNVAGTDTIIQGNHAFLAGKGFLKFLLAPDKNKFNAQTIGEKGSKKFSNAIEAFFPGSWALQHSFFKNALNTPGIAMIKDSNCPANLWYQVGCDCNYAWMTPSFDTGMTRDGQKGYTCTIDSTSDAVYFYGGTLTLFP